MATQVEICNMALTRIGVKKLISAIDDGSTEANMCDLYYDEVRRRCLTKGDWTFARKRLDLTTEAGDPPAAWAYQFQVPSDLLVGRRIDDGMQTPSNIDGIILYTMEWSPDSIKKLVYTDQEDACLIYTWDQDDEAQFDAFFTSYFAWVLAGELAMALHNNLKRQETCEFKADAVFSDAIEANVVTEPTAWAAMLPGSAEDTSLVQSRR